MTLTPADVVMLAKKKGAAPRGLHLHRARRLLRVRARHRGGRAGRRGAHGHDLERLRAGAAPRRPLPRDRGVQGGPQGLRRGLLQAAHRRRAQARARDPAPPPEARHLDGDRGPRHPHPERLRGRDPRPRALRARRGRGRRRPSTSRASTRPTACRTCPRRPFPLSSGAATWPWPRGCASSTSATSPATPGRARTARAAGSCSSAASAWRWPRTACARAPARTAAAASPASGPEVDYHLRTAAS